MNVITYNSTNFYFQGGANYGPIGNLLTPGGFIYNLLPASFPIIYDEGWPNPEAVCPLCKNYMASTFYFSSFALDTPVPTYKNYCKSCNKTGLHPIPMSELYDILEDYDADL